MGFPDRLLAPDEKVVLVLRRHVRVLAGPVLLLLAVCAGGGVLVGLSPEGAALPWVRAVIAVAAALVLARWVVLPFLRWRNHLHAVTDRRLLLREGVLRRTGRDLPLGRIDAISFDQTLVERMLGCGTLVVESDGEAGHLVLADIPRVVLVQRTVHRVADELYDPDDDPRAAVEDVAIDLDDADEDLRATAGRPGRRGRGVRDR